MRKHKLKKITCINKDIRNFLKNTKKIFKLLKRSKSNVRRKIILIIDTDGMYKTSIYKSK